LALRNHSQNSRKKNVVFGKVFGVARQGLKRVHARVFFPCTMRKKGIFSLHFRFDVFLLWKKNFFLVYDFSFCMCFAPDEIFCGTFLTHAKTAAHPNLGRCMELFCRLKQNFKFTKTNANRRCSQLQPKFKLEIRAQLCLELR